MNRRGAVTGSRRCALKQLFLAFFLICGAQAISAEPGAAMWVYETGKVIQSPAAVTELLAFCGQHRIDELFWDTHFIFDGARSSILDSSELRQFLTQASQAHLKVHALAGDPSDIEPSKESKVLSRVDALISFNAAGPATARFAGLHLDSEPHASPAWKGSSEEERTQMLARLVEIHAKTARRLHEQNTTLIYGGDFVFWLGKTKPDGSPAYPITFQGVTKDPESHLLDIMDEFALMSYRGFAEGKNGIIDLVARTVERADRSHAQVFVGFKMAPIGPPLETFSGRGENALQRAVAAVNARFASDRHYAGVAYFHYSAFREMR